MKTKHFILAMVGIFTSLYVAIHLTSSRPQEERRLEIYTALETYYIDLNRLEVQTAGSDSVFFFRTFDDLGFWLSEKTEIKAIEAVNIKAYQDYLICTSENKEGYGCHEKYIRSLTIK